MKKVLLGLLFLATMSMSAQETEFESPYSKGNFSIGGGFAIYNSENTNVNFTNTESKNYSINPSVGFFIKDNLMIGINTRYTKTQNVNEINGTENSMETDSYALGIIADKYYKIYKSFFLNFSGSIMYGTTNVTRANNTNTNNTDDEYFVVGVSPELSYVLNKHMSLKVGFNDLLSYRYSKNEDPGGREQSSSNLYTSLGSSSLLSDLSIGFRYFF
ncbi:outer membrane beta-barrel protein [Wenyingzhuangia marina]|uniref:Outer membrane protein beta-barrel domain-containing protein n=1 Tax=Wenyingzhuangia marina TaxID=1195760 RepID=A0A1M5W3I8_9FLAO|nr:outer membrane beta-barrel protein [Wenyingzhuangia marina]GGF76340.1 hypothetical protein GCM10011397_19090 [Wenyingzhuangia marina]SHH81763.1 Outer membrane protein beta-barrel domain-containing protein [Wenyingzhuangia marina]